MRQHMCKRYVGVKVGGDLVTGKTFVLNCAFLQKTNHSTVSQLNMDSLYLLHPQGIKYDIIPFLVTDGPAYMKKCYKDVIEALFSKTLHVTCIAHMLHNVAEAARASCPKVDQFVSS